MAEAIDSETTLNFSLGDKVTEATGKMTLLTDRIIQIMTAKANNALRRLFWPRNLETTFKS